MNDRDFFKDPPLTTCGACTRMITFAHNPITGKDGPLDYKSTVYVSRRDQASERGLLAITGNQFLESVDKIILKDGTVIQPGDLKFLSSHFGSCPAAARFSGRNRKGAGHAH